MDLNIKEDLWSYLANGNKPVVIFGMGNGADKVLNICTSRGIEVVDFFASDAFVRGQAFHGKTVMTYSQVRQKYGDGNFIVLLSFATSIPEVLEQIRTIASENELYAPDVPVFGNNIFDLNFFKKYENDIDTVFDMLADDISRAAYCDIISYKLTGNIEYLLDCEHSREEIFTSLLSPASYRVAADLGAYNGDTIRELIEYAPSLKYAIALEPDRKSFKKLERYADSETRCQIAALNIAAYSESKTLYLDSTGNKSSTPSTESGSHETQADSLDNILAGHRADYIKYDVEGAEMQAILGSTKTIQQYTPDLCVSLYHRSEDIFLLPMLIDSLNPNYTYYVRRGRYLPAWDINLIAVGDRT